MEHTYWRDRFLFRQWYSFACKMAESSTTSSEPAKQKRTRGRPRKQQRGEEDLEVRVEGKELAIRTTRKDLQADEALFSLSVPNRLLFEWHRIAQKPKDYIPLLNARIVDKVVAIQPDCCQIADKLACRAGRLRSQVATATSGKREVLLGKCAHIPVYRGSTVAPQPLLEEVDDLRAELADTLVEMADRQEEISTLRQVMEKMALERAAMMNHGKTVEELSERHRRRKLSHFRNVAEAALWFAESFGLVPDKLTTHIATSGEQISVHFGGGTSHSSPYPTTTTRIPDEFCAMQTLYLLDRFGVSDEFYHELTQVEQHIDCLI